MSWITAPSNSSSVWQQLYILSSLICALLAFWLLLDNEPFCHWPCVFTFAWIYISFVFWTFRRWIGSEKCRCPKTSTTRSQVRAQRWWLLGSAVIFLICFLKDTQMDVERGEGSIIFWGDGRASDLAKSPERKPNLVFEPYQTSNYKRHQTKRTTAKRSYKRAVRRAEQHGFAVYKGSLCSAARLGTTYKGPQQHRILQAIQNPNHVQGSISLAGTAVDWAETLGISFSFG